MTVRERLEREEITRLSPYAAKSAETRGRGKPISADSLRAEFQRDRDRIIHSKGFRRLKDKTQMVLVPSGDHYRTRLSHTLEVSQIARTIARALRLNEDLTEAIALGHDLGHAPFGHMGERTLDKLFADGFIHNDQSLRQVDILENDGRGLNLTYETRDGILRHSGELTPTTLEGWCVRYSDRIAYVNHDIDDSIRSGLLDAEALPKDCVSVLGGSHGERIERVIGDIVSSSMDKPRLEMSGEVLEALTGLRAFLTKNVYRSEAAERDERKISRLITALYERFMDDASLLPEAYAARREQDGHARCVVDYIAGMTDKYAIKAFTELFIPRVGANNLV